MEPDPFKDQLRQKVLAGDVEGTNDVLRRNNTLVMQRSLGDFGLTPLHVAIIQKKEPAAIELIHGGADVNAKDAVLGSTPLHQACNKGLFRVARTILDSKRLESLDTLCNNNTTPLLVALTSKNEAVALLLIQRGADVNIRELPRGFTPLHIAAENGLVECVKDILNCGRVHDIDAISADKATPLHVALISRQESVARLLIQRGADVTLAEREGCTPLHLAVERNLLNAAIDILNSGGQSNVNSVAQGRLQRTPLHIAISLKHLDLALVLVKKGANISTCDAVGNNAIHFACERDTRAFLEVTWPFINRKEDFYSLNYDNYSPMAVSVRWNSHETLNYLIEQNIDVNFGDPSPFHVAVETENMIALELLACCDNLDFEKRSTSGLTPLELALGKEFYKCLHIFSSLYKRGGIEGVLWEKCIEFGLGDYVPKEFDPEIEDLDRLLNKCIHSQSSESLNWFMKWLSRKEPTTPESAEKYLVCVRKIIQGIQHFGFSLRSENFTQLKNMTLKFPAFNDDIDKPTSFLGSFCGKSSISLKDLDKACLGKFCPISTSDNEKTVRLSEVILRNCPSNCEKKDQCLKVRLLVQIAQEIQERLIQDSRLMRNLQPDLFLVGSVAEGTRLFSASEADICMKLGGLENNPLEIENDATRVYVPDSLSEVLGEFCDEKTKAFDFPKFLEHYLDSIRESLKKMTFPSKVQVQPLTFKPCSSCKDKAKGDDLRCQTHCLDCAPGVTHTKIGACLIFKYRDMEFLSMDLVPLFPIRIRGASRGTSSVDLMNKVITTCLNMKPVGWLHYIRSNILKRDLILSEDLQREARKRRGFQLSSIKLIHYGKERNYMILPAQQLELADLSCGNKRQIYSYMKALKDFLNLPVKSYIMKKVILSHHYYNPIPLENPSKLGIQLALWNACLHPTLQKHFFAAIDGPKWDKLKKSHQPDNKDFEQIPLRI